MTVLEEAPICHAFLRHHLTRRKGSGVIVDDEDRKIHGDGDGEGELEEVRIEVFGARTDKVEICGLPMQLIDGTTDAWYCPSCDRRDIPEIDPPEPREPAFA